MSDFYERYQRGGKIGAKSAVEHWRYARLADYPDKPLKPRDAGYDEAPYEDAIVWHTSEGMFIQKDGKYEPIGNHRNCLPCPVGPSRPHPGNKNSF